jgi:putative aldouronate transport system substrate-binding protein
LAVVASMASVALIAGCTGGQTTPDKSGGTQTTSSGPVDNSGIDATGKVYDTGGVQLPLVEPGSVELTYMGNDTWAPNVSFKDGLPVQNEIEKRTGVHMNWDVYSVDTELVLQTRLAAGTDLPDIVEIPPFDSNIGVQRYADNGVLIPLSDLIDQYAPNIKRLFEEHPDLKAAATSPDGEIYGIPGYWGEINEVVPDWIMIRQDWLTKLGLDMPTTPEQLHKVLTAFKEQDPNGNGQADEVPIVTLNMLATRVLQTGFGFPTNSSWWAEDGKVTYAPVDDRYEALLTYLHGLYQEGLISTDIEGTQRQDVVAQDRAGTYVHDPSDWLVGFDTLARTQAPDVDYEFTPVIAPDGGSTTPQLVKRDTFWHYYGVTKDAADPVTAMKWIDYVYGSQDGRMLYGYGVEGLSYELDADGKPQFTELITDNPDFDTPFLALRSIGAWPTYLINDPADAFVLTFAGTKVETIADEYRGKMLDPFPQVLGTDEEASVMSELWPDLETYLDESFVNFVIGNKPLSDFDAYVAQAKSLGLDEVIKVKQAQYDRYQELVG